jgi:hypothetical protein
MTVSTTGGGGVVAPYNPDDFGDIGLEDVSASDIAIPRLQIVHKEGKFKDSLSGAVYDSGLKVILLGLVKQRVFWKDETDEGDVPLCKSPNFDYGFPNVDPEQPRSKQFPWDRSNFEPSNAVPVEIGPSKSYPEGWQSNGLPVLPCGQCIFKEWDKGDWKQPPCAEQHTYPLLYSPEEGIWQPALYTVQKTGIKPSRTYMSAFAQAKQPFFSVYTTLELTLMKRGTVDYSVPRFVRGEPTDRNDWLEYANQMRSIREFVRSAPRRFDEEGGDAAPAPSANVNTPPPSAQPVPTAAASAPTPSVQATPPAPTAPAPAATPTAPAATTPPVAPPSPPAAAPAAAPAATDDLPF